MIELKCDVTKVSKKMSTKVSTLYLRYYQFWVWNESNCINHVFRGIRFFHSFVVRSDYEFLHKGSITDALWGPEYRFAATSITIVNYNQSQNIWHWLALVFMWDKALREGFNCCFRDFFASIDKLFTWRGEGARGYHFMKFRHFPKVS